MGHDAADQILIDQILIDLDGTAAKKRLGANALLGVSLAVARAAALSSGVPLYRHLGGVGGRTLPVPMMNIINGGAHADNNLDLQEFMIVPAGASTFAEALRMGAEVFHHLKGILKKNGLNTAVGDEGGFAPNLKSNEEAIRVIMEAIAAAGYRPGRDVGIALDAASSEFYRDGAYHLKAEKPPRRTAEQMAAYYEALCARYPIVSIEDGLAENDWKGWKRLTERMGRPGPARGGRHLRDQPRDPRQGDPGGDRKRRARQGEPDRDALGDAYVHRDGEAGRIRHDHLAPLRRDGGHVHR